MLAALEEVSREAFEKERTKERGAEDEEVLSCYCGARKTKRGERRVQREGEKKTRTEKHTVQARRKREAERQENNRVLSLPLGNFYMRPADVEVDPRRQAST